MREAFTSAITTNLSDASQSEGFSGSFTPKAIAKTASFAAAEAANGIPDGGKHNDSEKMLQPVLGEATSLSRLPFRDPFD